MNSEILWTNLSRKDISERFHEKGKDVSPFIVKQLLKLSGYVKRKALKSLTMKEIENRNEQFINISKYKRLFLLGNNPILSIDTKKKEHIGNFYREGKLFTKEVIKVYDHDFPSFSSGVVIPHGIYDYRNNKAYVSIGKSKDTSEFSIDNIIYHWKKKISKYFPKATSLLLLCDGGGSNSSRSDLVKMDLQRLSNEIGLKVRIAHYPPYSSKWNPIEHRVFPHITRAMEGVVLNNYDIVNELISETKTQKGLEVESCINSGIYQTGRKLSNKAKDKINVIKDNILPNWNYTILPNYA